MQNIISTPPPSDFEIDSFRLKIPYEKCKIISTELEQIYLTINANTSEIISERKNNKIDCGNEYMRLWVQVAYQNAKTDLGSQNVKDRNHKNYLSPNKYLIVTIHSKLLGAKYLDRITKDTIRDVYDALMSFNAFYCDYYTFLHSDVLDIDFCRNVQIPNWRECKSYIIDHLKPSKQLDQGCYEFNQKDNIGLQFGTRERSTYTKPYIKIYHKYIELTTKSKLFTERYLNDAIDIPTDLFRVEYTLRDKKHYKCYGMVKIEKDIDTGSLVKNVASSLIDMLSLSNEKKEYIVSHMFSYQFNEGVYAMPKPRKKSNIKARFQELGINTPRLLYAYLLLQSIKNYGDTDHNMRSILETISEVGFDKRTELRARREFEKMFFLLPEIDQDIILDNENESKKLMLSIKKSIEQIGINELHYFGKTGLKSTLPKII